MTEKTILMNLLYKRMHSLMGIWLTIFLMQHLLVNSQAAFFLGNDGKGFIKGVNSIHDFPYLLLIEFAVLAIPIFVHTVLGIKYLMTAKYNSFKDINGINPSLNQYGRNKAYTWQRITSYLLIFGILAHVIHMRIIQYPSYAALGSQNYYMVPVSLDPGIQTVANRLDVEIFDEAEIKKQAAKLKFLKDGNEVEIQKNKEEQHYVKTLEQYPLRMNEAVAVSKDFGTAELMMLRDSFKTPVVMALYAIFVLAACFHAFNGLWTFLISWGVTLSEKSQMRFLKLSYFLMLVFSFLGLSTIFATYWLNLKQ